MQVLKSHKITAVLVAILVLLLVLGGADWAYQANTSRHKTQTGSATRSEKTLDAELPKGVKASDWDLVLVNRAHPQNPEKPFDKVTVDDKQVDARIVEPLEKFRQAAQAAGYPTTLVSGYRSIAYQQQVFDTVMAGHERDGMSPEEARKATAAVVQIPGSSEHQTGLAVDLAGDDALAKYPQLDAAMDQFPSQQWLIKNAPDYGFILHFLPGKEAEKETGIDYESWHFRYVGVANAQYMTKHHLTLEAYIEQLKKAGRN
ncbi:M15 family metallopeptidase [Leuconostocaceae bacterium ESL0723]|nr:M15 family metallopeptidase [Leuconostocaceae bacterium ESL0723]